jgi:hypothetical protein
MNINTMDINTTDITIENDTIKMGMFFGLSIFSFSLSFFIYRKLKFINASNKNVEKLELQSSVHQIAEKFTMATNTVVISFLSSLCLAKYGRFM